MTDRGFELAIGGAKSLATSSLVRQGFSADTAEDAVSQACFKAWEKREQYDGRSSFDAWFVGIAANCARSSLKPKLQHRLLSIDAQEGLNGGYGCDAVDPRQDVYVAVSNRMDAEVIQAAIETLPKGLKQALTLFVSGSSGEQIASELGISTGAVRSRVHKARARVREMLGAE
ncbi:RNA polymerase sigma factor [bacterium]|nr:MAG: RNA polymerase sigma factor [bacterium]